MKAVKTKLQETKPDRVEAFEKGAQAFAKKIVGNFKDWEFYTGESMNPDGMIALLNYRPDGTTRTSSQRPHRSRAMCLRFTYSISRLLEGRPEGGQALGAGSSATCSYVHVYVCILARRLLFASEYRSYYGICATADGE